MPRGLHAASRWHLAVTLSMASTTKSGCASRISSRGPGAVERPAAGAAVACGLMSLHALGQHRRPWAWRSVPCTACSWRLVLVTHTRSKSTSVSVPMPRARQRLDGERAHAAQADDHHVRAEEALHAGVADQAADAIEAAVQAVRGLAFRTSVDAKGLRPSRPAATCVPISQLATRILRRCVSRKSTGVDSRESARARRRSRPETPARSAGGPAASGVWNGCVGLDQQAVAGGDRARGGDDARRVGVGDRSGERRTIRPSVR